MIGANLAAQQLPFNPIFLVSDTQQKWRLVANFALYLLPFLAGGLFLGTVFLRTLTFVGYLTHVASNRALLSGGGIESSGIVRVPFHLVRSEITHKRLEVIFQKVTLSPERLSVYFAKAKRLPAKTFDFVKFLETSLRSTQDAGR